jgi:hypothetical protein
MAMPQPKVPSPALPAASPPAGKNPVLISLIVLGALFVVTVALVLYFALKH